MLAHSRASPRSPGRVSCPCDRPRRRIGDAVDPRQPEQRVDLGRDEAGRLRSGPIVSNSSRCTSPCDIRGRGDLTARAAAAAVRVPAPAASQNGRRPQAQAREHPAVGAASAGLAVGSTPPRAGHTRNQTAVPVRPAVAYQPGAAVGQCRCLSGRARRSALRGYEQRCASPQTPAAREGKDVTAWRAASEWRGRLFVIRTTPTASFGSPVTLRGGVREPEPF
jgi:hypothetical protein